MALELPGERSVLAARAPVSAQPDHAVGHITGKARVQLSAADLDENGHARLGYQQAERCRR
jgi:hypothetical protein